MGLTQICAASGGDTNPKRQKLQETSDYPGNGAWIWHVCWTQTPPPLPDCLPKSHSIPSSSPPQPRMSLPIASQHLCQLSQASTTYHCTTEKDAERPIQLPVLAFHPVWVAKMCQWHIYNTLGLVQVTCAGQIQGQDCTLSQVLK